MLYREAVSISAASKQTSDPAPPSRSDAENILPVLNPDILPSPTQAMYHHYFAYMYTTVSTVDHGQHLYMVSLWLMFYQIIKDNTASPLC